MKTINHIIWKELRSHVGKIIAIVVFVLLGVAFQAMTPWPFKLIIDNILGNEPLVLNHWWNQWLFIAGTTKSLLIIFAVSVYFASSLLSNLFDYIANTMTKLLGQNMVQQFSQEAFDNLERVTLRHYRKQDVGDYLYRLSYDVSALGNIFEDALLPLITNTLYLVTAFTILWLISPGLTFIAVIMLPVLAITLYSFNKSIDRASVQSERANSILFSFIEEVLTQLKSIQAFNQEKRQSYKFEHTQNSALSHETAVYRIGYRMDLLVGLIVVIGYAAILLYGIHLAILGQITTGLLIIFIFYMDNLTSPLTAILSASATYREQYAKLRRVSEFFHPEFHINDEGTITEFENDNIEFNKVTVLGEDNTPILHHASFSIPAGKKTVIAGVSGSGKTTFISLLLRFIEPDSGTVTLGGRELPEYNLKSLRDHITYVPQEAILLNDTIHNNILFGQPDASTSDISKAVELAQAKEFIRHLPSGYDFKVGENGINLSGGQRQRILLARAFLKTDAKIGIFDEPLSSLDVKTRASIIQGLEQFAQNRTAIIVSNVLDIIKQAEHVIVINEGKILHEGSSMIESSLTDLILHS